MRSISLPSVASVIATSIRLDYPGQTVHRSLYGGSDQVVSRGPGRWAGEIELGPVGRSDPDRTQIMTMFAALRGRENWLEIPTDQATPAFASGTVLTVTAAQLVADRLHLTVSGASAGLDTGHWVRIRNRSYVVTGELRKRPGVGVSIEVEPAAMLDITALPVALTWRDVTIRSRVVEGPLSPLRGDWSGPWVIGFEEDP